MPGSCLLYYITDRSAFSGDESARRRLLLDKIAEATIAGVDYIQLREKDLSSRELESLAREAMSIVHQLRTVDRNLRTALLINSRTDVALACQADGVHLRAHDVSPAEVCAAWKSATSRDGSRLTARELPLISVSCHSSGEVSKAAENGATVALFSPVFQKKDAPATSGAGLEALSKSAHAGIPVLALGGITAQSARSCLNAGASGIAAIRLFQENDIRKIARALWEG
jgi:thiamine-phosphate pyrophosphorylase